MKVALIVSGFIRTWEHSKPSLKKLFLKGVDYDLFAHVYRENYFEYSARRSDVSYTDEQIADMFKDVNLKKLVIEDREKVRPILEAETQKYEGIRNYRIRIKESAEQKDNYVNLGIRIYDQLRKNHLCNLLRKEYEQETSTKYDFVVRTRFDVMYLGGPYWETYTNPKKIYIGHGGCGGFPDDILGIGTPQAMDEGYFSRFENLDKLCFSTVHRGDGNWPNWYPSWGDTILPVREFCSHDTLLRNMVYNGYDIEPAHVGVRLIRNENQILNWNDCHIGNVHVAASKITNGVIQSGDNSNFDVNLYNSSLE
jgi:hypothetical protein